MRESHRKTARYASIITICYEIKIKEEIQEKGIMYIRFTKIVISLLYY